MKAFEQGVLESAPGPTPWYMAADAREFPSQRGVLTWKRLTSGTDRWMTGLVAPDGTAFAILNTYCYVTRLGSSRLLVWFIKPNPFKAAASIPMMHFVAFDVDRLEPIQDAPAACEALEAEGSYMAAAGGEVGHLEVASELQEGLHRLAFPESMCVLDELVLLCHSRQVSLWIVKPRIGSIEVFPQDWFNKGQFDFGYQWPTRVARDPVTGRVFGDGIRIGVFALDNSKRLIDRWLDR